MPNTQSTLQQSQIITTNKVMHVHELLSIVSQINKAEFQRKSYWRRNSYIDVKKNKKTPTFNNYIKYLYKYLNSGIGISLGVSISDNKEKYTIIDGNNRINAIINFVKRPLWVFKYEFESYIDVLRKYIPEEDIENISYKQLYDYRRLKNLSTIYKYCQNLKVDQAEQVEDILEKIQRELKIKSNGSNSFLEGVKIIIIENRNGTREEYNNKFLEMNEYDGKLTQSEILAGKLYDIPIILKDTDISYKLIKYILEYYDDRDEGEILSIDKTIKKNIDNINAFELFVGIQYLMNEYSKGVISKYSGDNGLALIFKIVKIYSDSKNIDKNSVKNINISEFINILIKVSTIISNVLESVSCDADLDNKLFIKNSDIKVKKNNLYILCITILILIKNNVSDKDIIKKSTIAICYHIICNKIKNEEDSSEYYDKIVYLKNKDRLKYDAGGSFIDNQCNMIYNKNPQFIFENIKKSDMEDALSIWCNQANKPKSYKKKGKKRRQINIVERMIYSILFRTIVSQNDLHDKKMSIEHLVCYSSSYKGNIDIDRLGNKIPIPLDSNIKRSNKHISEYKKLCPEYYSNYIDKLMSSDDYDSIVNYNQQNSPLIHNNSNYEAVCERNKEYYIKKVVEYLFK